MIVGWAEAKWFSSRPAWPEVEPLAPDAKYVVLDMHRVTAIDARGVEVEHALHDGASGLGEASIPTDRRIVVMRARIRDGIAAVMPTIFSSSITGSCETS